MFLHHSKSALEVSETLALLLTQCACPNYPFLLFSAQKCSIFMWPPKKSEVSTAFSNQTFPPWAVFSCFQSLSSFLPHQPQNKS